MPAREKMPESQFKSIISALCERWHIPAYGDYLSERYWPAFSRLDDAGQRAFWQVLGVQEEPGKETVDAVCDDRSPARRH
jgi:hypothetical protein